MANEKLKKLIEAVNSLGYEIVEKYLCNRVPEKFYGEIKIFISPVSKIKDPLSKEILTKLADSLFSIGYGIVEYKLLCKYTFGDISLMLHSLPLKTTEE